MNVSIYYEAILSVFHI